MHSGFIAHHLQPVLNSHFPASAVFVSHGSQLLQGSVVGCVQSSVSYLSIQWASGMPVRVVYNQYMKDQPAEGKVRWGKKI